MPSASSTRSSLRVREREARIDSAASYACGCVSETHAQLVYSGVLSAERVAHCSPPYGACGRRPSHGLAYAIRFGFSHDTALARLFCFSPQQQHDSRRGTTARGPCDSGYPSSGPFHNFFKEMCECRNASLPLHAVISMWWYYRWLRGLSARARHSDTVSAVAASTRTTP